MRRIKSNQKVRKAFRQQIAGPAVCLHGIPKKTLGDAHTAALTGSVQQRCTFLAGRFAFPDNVSDFFSVSPIRRQPERQRGQLSNHRATFKSTNIYHESFITSLLRQSTPWKHDKKLPLKSINCLGGREQRFHRGGKHWEGGAVSLRNNNQNVFIRSSWTIWMTADGSALC